MKRDEIKAELAAIGSTYDEMNGWTHRDSERGKELVGELIRLNAAVRAAAPKAPKAWGPRGEAGTVVCPSCGKRGQDRGIVCDHCGYAVR